MDTFSLSFAVVFTACFSLGVVCGQGTELEIVKFEEDRTVNLTIHFDQLATELQNDDYYVIEVRTRLSDGKVEYDGRVVRWNNTCTVTYQKSVRCVSKMGPVELYKKINNSHLEIEWSWTWKDNNSGRLKTNKWKKKLQDMHYFNNDTTLMEFVTAKMMFAASTVNAASLLGYVVAVIVTTSLLLAAFKKWKKGIVMENNQPLEYPFPENYETGIILRTFTDVRTTYNQLRQRWRKLVSKPSEGESQETHKEVLPETEPKEPDIEESIHMLWKNCDEQLKDTSCSKDAVTEEEKAKLEYVLENKKLRFLLVGKTGSGKSSTGNTILGSKLFHTSTGFTSATSECQTHGGDVGKWKVEITDSPGLFDTRLTEDNIAIKIVQAVACLHPGPTAFLYVMKIERFTPEKEATYRRLKAIFDEDVTKHTVVVFTGGDSLSDEETNIGKMIEEAPPGFKDILKACGDRYVVFDNNAADKNPQVNRLLEIVEKMVEENSSPRYVCPKYMQISTQIEKEIQKRLLAVQQKEDEHKLYIRELQSVNTLLQEKARKAETEFKKREQHLKESMENKIKELEEKLYQNILSGEDMEKEMKKIVKENEQLEKELKEMQEKEQQQFEKIVRNANEDFVKIVGAMIDKRLKMDYSIRTDFRNKSAQNEEGFLPGLITAELSGIIAGVWKKICSISDPGYDSDRDPVKELN